uniref:3-ketoacyl-CoA thiolase B, peroxisomal n=2 Tax=Lygus hesperus TaxID=30085 RepID=A0A146MAP0_LYGHE
MSQSPMTWEGQWNARVFINQNAKDCLLPMGITSENVAKQYNITREDQDSLAVQSHTKALEAIKTNRFKDEIVPIQITRQQDGEIKIHVIDKDEGPRPNTSMETLAKLKPAFAADGTTTAGNCSQVSDGAAVVILTTRKRAQELNLPILGSIRSFAVVGVPPSVMGIGPAFAIPKALKLCNLTTEDIDVYEINEAFASQACMCVKHLKLDWEKVNPNGGAIALGHPLGCTGARQLATLLYELRRRGQRYGVVSMCIGSGMGAAGIFEAEDISTASL